MGMIIVAGILWIIGILVGTHLYLWVQGLIFIGIILYLRSESFRRLEIGGIFVMALIGWFIVGMIIGDISYAVQTDAFNKADFSNPFAVGSD